MAEKLRIVNLGISSFYDALVNQDCKVAQIDWHPPVKLSQELQEQLLKVTTGALGAGALGGLIFVLAFAAVLTWLCLRTDSKVKAEYALSGKK